MIKKENYALLFYSPKLVRNINDNYSFDNWMLEMRINKAFLIIIACVIMMMSSCTLDSPSPTYNVANVPPGKPTRLGRGMKGGNE